MTEQFFPMDHTRGVRYGQSGHIFQVRQPKAGFLSCNKCVINCISSSLNRNIQEYIVTTRWKHMSAGVLDEVDLFTSTVAAGKAS